MDRDAGKMKWKPGNCFTAIMHSGFPCIDLKQFLRNPELSRVDFAHFDLDTLYGYLGARRPMTDWQPLDGANGNGHSDARTPAGSTTREQREGGGARTRGVLDQIRRKRARSAASQQNFFNRLQKLGVSEDMFINAQQRALNHGSQVHQVLLADGSIAEDDYFALIAEEFGLPFIDDLHMARIVPELGSPGAAPDRACQVFSRSPEGVLVLYVAPDRNAEHELRAALDNNPQMAKRVRISTPRAIAKVLEAQNETRYLELASNQLHSERPDQSAKATVVPWQAYVAGTISIGLPLWIYTSLSTLLALIHILASAIFAFGLYVRLGAVVHAKKLCTVEMNPGKLDYPMYSVLIALHREAAIIPQLVRAMAALDWPAEKLEVFYLCEGDDSSTIETLKVELLPANHRIIAVPPGLPRTKPKALNYGLLQSCGEFIVIYDAEDRPDPGQLKEAFWRLTEGGATLACVQAPLLVSNGRESWFSRMFAFEYIAHFKGLLPYLARLDVPLPLGGTSNHFSGLM